MLFVLLLFSPGFALASDLIVTVRTPQGKPISDAVVSLPAPHGRPIRFAWPYTMAQHNMQFDPFVLIVPVGARVAFPNLDKVRHHVYSFSPAHPFELKLYGHDETRFVTFDKPGVVALGCNIHDSMVAFIMVVDTPYAAKTDAAGEAVIHEAPPGPADVRIWRPYLKAPQNAVASAVVVPREGAARALVTVVVSPRPDPMRMY
jgi:hypothetical protein